MSNTKVVDLFAGTGAFSLVFNELDDFEVVFANDYDKSSKENYDINFDHKLIFKDLNKIKIKDIPEHDILTGGFPCQPLVLLVNKKDLKMKEQMFLIKLLK